MSRKKTVPAAVTVNEVVKRPDPCYKPAAVVPYFAEFVDMNISIADVEHVARLARLELSDEEKSLFAVQMGAILGYVDTLKELDTEGILPTSHAVPMENSFREDVACPAFGVESALANAPDRVESFFRVPKVIE
jgi:aspartyl-tRNA(Asn)/glutamyl-tRNA(Gln) amidotransferase subunit C